MKLVLFFLVVPMGTYPFGKPVAIKNVSKNVLFNLRQLRLWYCALSWTPATLQKEVENSRMFSLPLAFRKTPCWSLGEHLGLLCIHRSTLCIFMCCGIISLKSDSFHCSWVDAPNLNSQCSCAGLGHCYPWYNKMLITLSLVLPNTEIHA